MKIPLPLTILTLLALAIISWITCSIGLRTRFFDVTLFDLIYVVPGTIFSILVVISKSGHMHSFADGFAFVALSSGLYALVYIISWFLVWIGVCVIPSIGAVVFLWLIRHFLRMEVSRRCVFIALLAGPVSGGLAIWMTFKFDEFELIMFVPVIIWWLFMALLIDLGIKKTIGNV